MTTRTTATTIDIVADASLRDAAAQGAAVIALDTDLNAVLFADAAGRALFGAAGAPANPALRQVRSAARAVMQTGKARVSLRQSTRAGTRTLDAALVLRSAEGARPAYVLMTIAGLGRPLDDADLLDAVAPADGAAGSFVGGELRHATSSFGDGAGPALAAHVAAFEAGGESIVMRDEGDTRWTLLRAPFGRIVAIAQALPSVEAPAPESPEPAAICELPDIPEPSAGFASFSVKRPKLGERRPGMSMGALLQRWHSRGPETPADSPAPAATRPDAGEATGGSQAPEADDAAERSASEMIEPATAVSTVEVPEARPTTDAVGDAEGPLGGSVTALAGHDAVPADAIAVETADDAVENRADTAFDAVAESGAAADAEVDEADVDAPTAEHAADPSPEAETLPDEASGAPIPDLAEVAARRPAFVPRFDVPPVRFVWQIDREGAFRFLSPDFAAAVGPNAADVVGRSFAMVSKVFGFDETREIARLLERRDTWSGRTIFWPIEGSDRKAPVDLAALPVYGRDRSFDGFRGFGIVRLNESVADEEGLGLHLTQGAAPEQSTTSEAAREHAAPSAEPSREKPFLRRFEAETFGRRAEPPAVAPSQAEPASETDPAQKVIRLEERRRPREGMLSTAEEAAFRAIGAKLGSKAEAESPGALRFEDPAASEAPLAGDPADAVPQTAEAAPPVETPEAPTAKTRAPIAEPDPIEPALEALSEKLARAEAEADRRLAERRFPGAAKAEPDATTDAILPEADQPGTAVVAEPAEDHAAENEPAAVEAMEPAAVEASDLSAAEAPEATFEASSPEAAVEIDEPVEVTSEDEAADRLDAASTPERSEPSEPVADATTAVLGDEGEGEDEHEAGEPPLDIEVFERLFAGLPLAVLVQVREHTVYSNAEFARLTGHADAAAVEAAGGLDALVLDRHGEGTLALVRADGEVVEVRAHMQRIAEGGRSALLMSFQSVEDEAAEAGPALEDLRQEVEELQAVLDTATDGVVLLDINGHIRAMNGSAHALFGIGADEAFGRHLSSLFAHESQKATADYLDMLRDDGIGGILNDGREVIGRVSQGGFIPLFITIGRLSGERGWCVVIRDIAHWKRIEEDLVNARRQAEAASLHKSRFLANISHELRTPLNAIIGFADVMSSECFGPIGNERYLEYLGDIKRSGHHVLDLVNDLLDISKIEAGKIDLSFEAVSLNEVISEAVSLMQPQANRERVIVRSNLPSSVPPVVADRRTMRQIALNLLANAIRFTPAGGQIIASTTYAAEGDVLLRFRDSGIGMTEREIELALTPFQQVHAPSANRGEGTGLGLPLTKAMVEANRAYFSIQSTPGEGTLVEIVFPAPRVLAD